VFAAIKARHPHVKIDILCSGANAVVVNDDPRVDNVYLYQKRPLTDYEVIRQIRQNNYDAVIDLINGESTSALILTHWCAQSAAMIGVQKRKYARYYDFAYYHDPTDDRHIIRNTLMCLEGLGMDGESADPYAPYYLNENSVAKAEAYVSEVKESFPEANRLVGINLSAGQPTRNWATEKYAQLIKSIRAQDSSQSLIILFAMPPDRERAKRLVNESENRIAVVPEGLNLNEASAIISQLDVLISPDTSLIHIARSFKVPVVGMYPQPPHNFIRWHPYEQPDGAVLGRLGDNIFDIEPGAVVDCYQKLMISPRVTRS
jgi:ADP-heptose:LPS heptosyltransferase